MKREKVRSDSFDFVGLYIVLALTGLVFSVSIADQFALPKYALLQAGTLVLLAYWMFRRSSREILIRRTATEIFVLLYALILVLSTVFSLNPVTSFLGKYHRYEGLLTQISYFVLFFLAVQQLSDDKSAWRHAKIMVLLAALVSLYGLVQYAGYDVFNWGVSSGSAAGQSLSTFGNRSSLGGFLVLALPLAIAWLLTVRGKERWVAGLTCLIVAATLVSTETRASWLGAGVGLVFFAFLVRAKFRLKGNQIVVILLTVALLLALFLVGSTYSGKLRDILFRAAEIARFAGGTGAERLEIWKSALRMTADRPLLGTGPDAFRLLFTRFQSARYAQMTEWQAVADDAHNYFLNLAANSGLLGLFAMAAFLIALLWKGTRQASHGGSLLLSAFLASVISYVVHLSFSVGNLASNAWMWTILGLLSVHLFPVEADRKSRTKRFHVRFRWPLLVVVLLTALAGTAFATTRYLADSYFAQVQRHVENGRVDEAIGSFEQAIRFAPYNSGYREDLALLYIDLANQNSDYGLLLKAVIMARESVEMNAHNIDGYMILADAYLVGAEKFGRVEDAREAEEILARSLKIKPQSALTHYFFARALLARDEKKGAEAHLRKALLVEPDLQEAQKLLAGLIREDRVEH